MDFPPDSVLRGQTCCFTGHRFIAGQLRENLIAALDRRIKEFYDAGYRYFMTGGALGFDTLAAAEVLRTARFAKDIRLILALPCRDQTLPWEGLPDSLEHLRRYKQILGMAHGVVYVSDFYTDTCMKERNRFMVEHSAACIAYYNGCIRSGTGQTFRMAEKAGLEIRNLWNDMNHTIQ